MKYELAKKLKECGFPQDGLFKYGQGWNFVTGPDTPKDTHGISSAEYERLADKCYCPTLSELIEACGDGFAGVIRDPIGKKKWIAHEETQDRTQDASSPEEAVAKLWIALHS